jgi:uncharacterized glyoxalase superfamily protein PhnB
MSTAPGTDTSTTDEPPTTRPGSSVIPALRYADAAAAVRWLAAAFGFTEHVVHRDDAGAVAHAEMTWTTGMVMFGSGGDARSSGSATTGIYLLVDDIEAHRQRAVAAGADADGIVDTAYGTREYGVRDLEGNSWHVGTYDPWSA